MNSLEIPSCYDCILKIKYGTTVSYQKINLSKFREIRNRLNVKVEFYMLAYLSNCTYSWIKIEDAFVDGTIICRKYHTNFKSINLFMPLDEKMPWATLPNGFFSEEITEKQWALGLYAADNFVFSVRNKYDRKIKESVDINTYFNNKKIDHSQDRWYVDELPFRHRDFMNIKEVTYEYLENFYTHTMDVYLVNSLFRANILLPLGFYQDVNRLATSVVNRVPKDMYWLFQLLYGRDSYVYFQIDMDTNISFSDIKRWKRWKKKVKRDYTIPRIVIELNHKKVRPVVIHNNLAMRFNNEPTRR